MNHFRNNQIVRSDAEFCDRIGYNRSQVSECANGKRPVSRSLAYRIATAFPGVNAEYLLDEAITMPFLPEASEMIVGNYLQYRTSGQNTRVTNSHDIHVNPDCSHFVEMLRKQQEQIDRLLAIIERQQQLER